VLERSGNNVTFGHTLFFEFEGGTESKLRRTKGPMKTDSDCKSCCCCPQAAAVALGRWGLGLIFLLYGINKFKMGVENFAAGTTQKFENTILPLPLVSAFNHVLPFWEADVGVLLLLGLFRNATLFATAVLMISLTFGMAVLQQSQVVSGNLIYLAITLALLFLADYDRWVLFPCRRKTTAPAADPKSGSGDSALRDLQ